MLNLFSRNTSNKKKRKKIFQFKYETSSMPNEFFGYLNPSQDYSIISLKRLQEHGVDVNRFHFGKVTTRNHIRGNKFENIAGACEVTILFENTASGINNINIRIANGVNGTGAPPWDSPINNKKVEKKIHNVLVLKESKVEFRLGHDFIQEFLNIPPERKKIAKKNLTHQMRFKDGVIVDLEQVENEYDIYDDEEDEKSSDEEGFENDEYIDENDDNIELNKNSKNEIYNKLNNYKIFKIFENFLMELNNRVGLSNIIIIFLSLLIMISYTSSKSQSLVEELIVIPYNQQFTRPGIDDKLEDYARKLKTTTTFLELFNLDKRQGKEGEEARGQELYTNLVEYTASLDNAKRTLLDTYNQEVSYSLIFQQNINNLSKYLSLKKRSNIFRMIPFIKGDEYFPLTKNIEDLVNDVEKIFINNTLSVTEEVHTINTRCDMIIDQVEKMNVELELFIKDRKIFPWLQFIIKGGGKIDNLGLVYDIETPIKVQRLLIDLYNDLNELSSFSSRLRDHLSVHSSDLMLFANHFRFTKRITNFEIKTIKEHLERLESNRRNIFDEKNLLKEKDDVIIELEVDQKHEDQDSNVEEDSKVEDSKADQGSKVDQGSKDDQESQESEAEQDSDEMAQESKVAQEVKADQTEAVQIEAVVVQTEMIQTEADQESEK